MNRECGHVVTNAAQLTNPSQRLEQVSVSSVHTSYARDFPRTPFLPQAETVGERTKERKKEKKNGIGLVLVSGFRTPLSFPIGLIPRSEQFSKQRAEDKIQ